MNDTTVGGFLGTPMWWGGTFIYQQPYKQPYKQPFIQPCKQPSNQSYNQPDPPNDPATMGNPIATSYCECLSEKKILKRFLGGDVPGSYQRGKESGCGLTEVVRAAGAGRLLETAPSTLGIEISSPKTTRGEPLQNFAVREHGSYKARFRCDSTPQTGATGDPQPYSLLPNAPTPTENPQTISTALTTFPICSLLLVGESTIPVHEEALDARNSSGNILIGASSVFGARYASMPISIKKRQLRLHCWCSFECSFPRYVAYREGLLLHTKMKQSVPGWRSALINFELHTD